MRLSPSPLCVLSSPSAGLRRGRSGMERFQSASVLDQVRTVTSQFRRCPYELTQTTAVET